MATRAETKAADGRLLTADELAKALRVPKSWIRERSRRNRPPESRLPGLRIGRYVRFDLATVRAWIEQQTQQ